MKAYGSYDEWKKDQSSGNKKLITTLETIVADCAPHLQQSVKWGQGCWIDHKGPKLYIHAEPDHVQLGFYAGSTLKDPEHILQGKGKYVRFVRVFDAEDIDKQAVKALIRQLC